jgi:hypothetical protein
MRLYGRRRVAQRALACVIAVFSVLAVTPTRGYAWGDHGHRTVARIAARYLNDKASAAVNEILKADPYLAQKCPNESSLELKLACIASWPDPPLKDERPYTANWHFVDIPVTMVGNQPFRTSSYDVARDCAMSKRGDCAILALERLKPVLANPKEAPISRTEALKFIVHIVGDLHQPLHNVTDKKNIDDEKELGDLGGNTKIVQWLSMETSPRWKDYHWNLHAVWDEGIIDRTLEILKTDEDGFVRQLVSTLPAKGDQSLAKYQTGDSLAWADEGYKLAVFYAYGKLPAYDENYKYTKDGKEGYGGYILDAKSGYYEANREIVNHQLKKGGLRLAKLLNDLLSQ